MSGLTTRWSRPGQPGVGLGAILGLAGRAAHLEAVRRLVLASEGFLNIDEVGRRAVS